MVNQLPAAGYEPVLDYPEAPPRRRWGRRLLVMTPVWAVTVAAATWLTVSVQPHPQPAPPPPPPPAPAHSQQEIAAATDDACHAWHAGAVLIQEHRRPLLDGDQDALADSEVTDVVQLAYIRKHVGPAVPADLVAAINNYMDAAVELASDDAKGAHEAANEVVLQVNAAAAEIRTLCTR